MALASVVNNGAFSLVSESKREETHVKRIPSPLSLSQPNNLYLKSVKSVFFGARATVNLTGFFLEFLQINMPFSMGSVHVCEPHTYSYYKRLNSVLTCEFDPLIIL